MIDNRIQTHVPFDVPLPQGLLAPEGRITLPCRLIANATDSGSLLCRWVFNYEDEVQVACCLINALALANCIRPGWPTFHQSCLTQYNGIACTICVDVSGSQPGPTIISLTPDCSKYGGYPITRCRRLLGITSLADPATLCNWSYSVRVMHAINLRC